MFDNAVNRASDLWSRHSGIISPRWLPSRWPEFISFPQSKAAKLLTCLRPLTSPALLQLALTICLAFMCIGYAVYVVWYRNLLKERRDTFRLKLAPAALIGHTEIIKTLNWNWTSHTPTSPLLTSAALLQVCSSFVCLRFLMGNTNRHHASICFRIYFGLSAALEALTAVITPLELKLSAALVMAITSIVSKVVVVSLQWTTPEPETVPEQEDELHSSPESAWPFVTMSSIFSPPTIRPILLCKENELAFQANWTLLSTEDDDRLLKAFASTFSGSLLTVALPQVAYIMLTYAQPVFFGNLLQAAMTGSVSHTSQGLMLVTSALLFLGTMVSKTLGEYLVKHNAIAFQSILKTALYTKSLRLDKAACHQAGAAALFKWTTATADTFITTNFAMLAAMCEVAAGSILLGYLVGPWVFAFGFAIFGLRCFAELPNDNMGDLRSSKAIYNAPSGELEWKMLLDITSAKMTGMSSHIVQQARAARRDKVKQSRGLWRLEAHGKYWDLVTRFSILVLASTITVVRSHGSLEKRLSIIFPVFVTASMVCDAVAKLSRRNRNDLCRMRESVQDAQKMLQWDEPQERRCIGQKELFSTPNTESGWKGKAVVRYWRQEYAIVLENATIGPPGSTSSRLEGIDMAVHAKDVAILLGPSHSRKTLLLDAIAGTTSNVNMWSIYLNDASVAYCSRTQWIENATVKRNIIGANEFDEVRYRDIVATCMLDTGLEACGQTDYTIAGVGGSNLAPSLRERLCLARALYCKSPVLLLDTPFQQTWPRVTRLILNNLFEHKKGFLRRYPKAVVVATECPIFMAYANVACIIDRQGKLSQCSTRREALKFASKIPSYEAPVELIMDQSEYATNVELATFRSMRYRNLLESPTPSEEVHDEKPERKIAGKVNIKALQSQDEVSEATAKEIEGQIKRREFLKRAARMAMAAAIVQTFAEIYLAKATVENSGSMTGEVYEYLLMLHFALQVYRSALSACYTNLIPKFITDIHARFISAYGRSSLLSTPRCLEEILDAFFDDMNVLEHSLRSATFDVAYTISFLSASLLVLSVAHVAFSIGAVLLYATGFGMVSRYIDNMHVLDVSGELFQDHSQTLAAEIGQHSQFIRGIAWQRSYTKRFCESLREPLRFSRNRHISQLKFKFVVDLIVGVLAVATVYVGLNYDTGVWRCFYAVWYMVLLSLSDKVNNALNACNDFKSAMRSVARIYKGITDTPSERKPEHAIRLPEHWPQAGHIIMSSVSSYLNQSSGGKAIVNMDCDIFPGATVLLTGGPESGPSVFFNTLLNMVAREGLVLVDGVDPTELKADHLRSRITTLVSNPGNLWGTFRDCLITQKDLARIGDVEITDEMLEEALRAIGMLDAIRELGGLCADASVTNTGWSVAQKQMFAIAQAMVHHDIVGSKLLLMDDATYDLFDDMDEAVQHFIRHYFRDSTILCATSRRDALPYLDYHIDFDGDSMTLTHCSERAFEHKASVDGKVTKKWPSMAYELEEPQHNDDSSSSTNPEHSAQVGAYNRLLLKHRTSSQKLVDAVVKQQCLGNNSLIVDSLSPDGSALSPGHFSSMYSPGYDSASTLRRRSPFDGSPVLDSSSDEEPLEEDPCPAGEQSLENDPGYPVYEQSCADEALFAAATNTDGEPGSDNECPFQNEVQTEDRFLSEEKEGIAPEKNEEQAPGESQRADVLVQEEEKSSTSGALPLEAPPVLCLDEDLTLCDDRNADDGGELSTSAMEPCEAEAPNELTLCNSGNEYEPNEASKAHGSWQEDDDLTLCNHRKASDSNEASTCEDESPTLELFNAQPVASESSANDEGKDDISESDTTLTNDLSALGFPSEPVASIRDANDETLTLCSFREAYTPPPKQESSFKSPKEHIEGVSSAILSDPEGAAESSGGESGVLVSGPDSA